MALAIRAAATDALKEEAISDDSAAPSHYCEVSGPDAAAAAAAPVAVPVPVTSSRKQTQKFKHARR